MTDFSRLSAASFHFSTSLSLLPLAWASVTAAGMMLARVASLASCADLALSEAAIRAAGSSYLAKSGEMRLRQSLNFSCSSSTRLVASASLVLASASLACAVE